ncbi:hypothetical protein [Rufibacter roseus]|uniref:PEGA domain-containing protein n=1 Tax=Rufibacter roseus TaxID=1567108 RepID=A0ABW2DJ01_9BACT|nr:hypothetical protein [Rufibacter roseus]
MNLKTFFSLSFFTLLICLLSAGSGACLAQENAEAVLLINGKKADQKSSVKLAALGKSIEIKVPVENGLQVTVYLVRGYRPIKVQKFESAAHLKNFDFGAWFKNQSQTGTTTAEEDNTRFDIARPGDRLVLEVAWPGGGNVYSVVLQ